MIPKSQATSCEAVTGCLITQDRRVRRLQRRCCGISRWQARAPPEHGLGAGEVHDLLAHDADAAVVRGVELQDHAAEGVAVHLAGHRQDRGGLPRAGGAIEEHVGEPVLVHQPLDCAGVPRLSRRAEVLTAEMAGVLGRQRTCVYDLLVGSDVIKRLRPVLLYPVTHILPLSSCTAALIIPSG